MCGFFRNIKSAKNKFLKVDPKKKVAICNSPWL